MLAITGRQCERRPAGKADAQSVRFYFRMSGYNDRSRQRKNMEDFRMNKTLLALTAALAMGAANAKPVYTGPDYSGMYACTGNDAHEGPYTGTVTIERVLTQSEGNYGAYRFKLEAPGYGVYLGEAAAQGRTMAIHFAHTDPATKDYGTGIAAFTKINGKWTFHKYYYEPEFKGGNYGEEDCIQQ